MPGSSGPGGLVTVCLTRVHDGGRTKRLQAVTRQNFIQRRSSTGTLHRHVVAHGSNLAPRRLSLASHAAPILSVPRCHSRAQCDGRSECDRDRQSTPGIGVWVSGSWLHSYAWVSGSRTMCWGGIDCVWGWQRCACLNCRKLCSPGTVMARHGLGSGFSAPFLCASSAWRSSVCGQTFNRRVRGEGLRAMFRVLARIVAFAKARHVHSVGEAAFQPQWRFATACATI